jgi:serine/threonine protein kinase
MRATNDKLMEKYIVVIARELGKALKGLHAAGILHRDIKGGFSFHLSVSETCNFWKY